MLIQTIQGDTWDKLSFRLYNNEYFENQIRDANMQYVGTVVFPSGVMLQVPTTVAPLNVSSVVWGSVIQYV